jgi:2'-5' RNA ligase
MDHLIAPLDADHEQVFAHLASELADALAIDVPSRSTGPHITLVSYTGLAPEAAVRALAPVARATEPLRVRAHGYGLFTGDEDTDLSLHVMVVRTRALDELQHRGHVALAEAGACVDGISRPAVWTPHVTLLDHSLTPELLGRAVELLARRPHRRWTISLASMAVARRDRAGTAGPTRLTIDLGANDG